MEKLNEHINSSKTSFSQDEVIVLSRIEKVLEDKELSAFEDNLKNALVIKPLTKQTWFRAAAAFITVALISTVMLVLFFPSNNTLFNKYYEYYPPEKTSGFARGEYNNRMRAMIFYSEKDYVQAQSAFSEILMNNPDDIESKFLNAFCLIETGNSGHALKLLTEIIRAPLSYYSDDALWYAALINVKIGDFNSSKDFLGRIESSSEYFPSAKKLSRIIKQHGKN